MSLPGQYPIRSSSNVKYYKIVKDVNSTSVQYIKFIPIDGQGYADDNNPDYTIPSGLEWVVKILSRDTAILTYTRKPNYNQGGARVEPFPTMIHITHNDPNHSVIVNRKLFLEYIADVVFACCGGGATGPTVPPVPEADCTCGPESIAGVRINGQFNVYSLPLECVINHPDNVDSQCACCEEFSCVVSFSDGSQVLVPPSPLPTDPPLELTTNTGIKVQIICQGGLLQWFICNPNSYDPQSLAPKLTGIACGVTCQGVTHAVAYNPVGGDEVETCQGNPPCPAPISSNFMQAAIYNSATEAYAIFSRQILTPVPPGGNGCDCCSEGFATTTGVFEYTTIAGPQSIVISPTNGAIGTVGGPNFTVDENADVRVAYCCYRGVFHYLFIAKVAGITLDNFRHTSDCQGTSLSANTAISGEVVAWPGSVAFTAFNTVQVNLCAGQLV